MHTAVGLVLLLLVATFAPAQTDGTLRARLETWSSRLRATATAETTKLSDEDLDLLEKAKLDPGAFSPQDVTAIVLTLRFGQSLSEQEWTPAVAHAVSKDGRVLAWMMFILCVQRGRMDDAAQLVTAAVREATKEQRGYSTWKRWETFFAARDDVEQLTHDFVLALLRRAEQGDVTERGVVADLIDKPGLTKAQVPAIREDLEKQWRARPAAAANLAADAEPKETVWLEDRRGLRQIPAASIREVDRWEIRLQHLVAKDSPAEPWGTLVQTDTADADEVQAKFRALRSVVRAARAEPADFDAGIGAIAVKLRPDEEPWELRTRIMDLNGQLTGALAAGAMAVELSAHGVPVDAKATEHAESIAKQVLDAVRLGARRLRELTVATARQTPPDATGDRAAAEALGKATVVATRWISEFTAHEPPPADTAAWHDMMWTGSRSTTGRTHVETGKDRVSIVVFDTYQGAPDVPGTYRDTMTTDLTREDLREASFESDSSRSPHGLVITTKRPTWRMWFTVAPTNDAGLKYTVTVDGMIRGGRQESVCVQCDSDAHVQALVAELKRFAAGDGR